MFSLKPQEFWFSRNGYSYIIIIQNYCSSFQTFISELQTRNMGAHKWLWAVFTHAYLLLGSCLTAHASAPLELGHRWWGVATDSDLESALSLHVSMSDES